MPPRLLSPEDAREAARHCNCTPVKGNEGEGMESRGIGLTKSVVSRD